MVSEIRLAYLTKILEKYFLIIFILLFNMFIFKFILQLTNKCINNVLFFCGPSCFKRNTEEGKIIKEKNLILFIQKRDKKTERFFIKNIRAFKKNRNKNEKETKTPLLQNKQNPPLIIQHHLFLLYISFEGVRSPSLAQRSQTLVKHVFPTGGQPAVYLRTSPEGG